MPDVACRWSPSRCVVTCSFLCVQTWRERETQRWPALVSYKSRVSPCPPPPKKIPAWSDGGGRESGTEARLEQFTLSVIHVTLRAWLLCPQGQGVPGSWLGVGRKHTTLLIAPQTHCFLVGTMEMATLTSHSFPDNQWGACVMRAASQWEPRKGQP